MNGVARKNKSCPQSYCGADVKRLGRAAYQCAQCGKDVSLEVMLLTKLEMEQESMDEEIQEIVNKEYWNML